MTPEEERYCQARDAFQQHVDAFLQDPVIDEYIEALKAMDLAYLHQRYPGTLFSIEVHRRDTAPPNILRMHWQFVLKFPPDASEKQKKDALTDLEDHLTMLDTLPPAPGTV